MWNVTLWQPGNSWTVEMWTVKTGLGLRLRLGLVLGLELVFGLGLVWLFRFWVSRLKMICNDFLVVKVNCRSYVFNIVQSIWVLRNIKDKKIAEKTSKSAHRWFVYFSQVMTSYQENTTKQPIECWVLTIDRAKQIAITINVEVGY